MSSLRDQLMKSGVASKKQQQQARSQKKQNKKQGVDPQAENRRRLEEEKKKQVARDKELNRQREAARAEKEKQAQIRQIIETNTVRREEGDTSYSFVDNKKIKSWYLTDKQVEELSSGRLAMAKKGEDKQGEGEYALFFVLFLLTASLLLLLFASYTRFHKLVA